MHFALDENGPFHGSVPRVGVDLSIPQGRWGGMDKRNPYLLEANMAGESDGVLIVDKPFLGPAGTVAFFGLPLPAEAGEGALLDARPIQLGFLKENELRAYARMSETHVRSGPLPAVAGGLYAWRWHTRGRRVRMEFVHVAADRTLSHAGSGMLPAFPSQKGPVRWLNHAASTAPFRGRMTSLGVWQRMLSDDELKSLGRY